MKKRKCMKIAGRGAAVVFFFPAKTSAADGAGNHRGGTAAEKFFETLYF